MITKTVRRAASVTADALDPFRLVGLVPRSAPPATVVCVYRARNADTVRRLVGQARCAGAQVALWALDDVVPDLAWATLGSGAGTRFGHLNRLVDGIPADHWVVVCDDDVTLQRRGLASFLALSARLGLQLSQPAHSRRGSHWSYRITRRHLLRAGRETTFVEIGPVLAISPDGRHLVLPFEDVGMGWGAELGWYDLQQQGLRLGIIDVTPMRHLGKVGAGYDSTDERARMQVMLEDRGLRRWQDFQKNLHSYRR